MGFFYTVVGWLELDDGLRAQVMKIVYEDKEALGNYRDSWYFPEIGGGYSRFAFFGCTVRDSAVTDVKAQLLRIARDCRSLDGEDTNFAKGLFHLTAEDESRRLFWSIADGSLGEREEMNSFTRDVRQSNGEKM